jgi:hypothetical protein
MHSLMKPMVAALTDTPRVHVRKVAGMLVLHVDHMIHVRCWSGLS